MTVDQLTAVEIEREIIGNLLNNREAFLDVFGDLQPDDFWNRSNAAAFEAFSRLYETTDFIDLHTLSKEAKVDHLWLVDCMNDGWLSANIKAKAKKVVELAHKRRTYQQCMDLMSQLKDLDGETISAKLSDVAASISLRSEKKKIYSAEELTWMVLESQEKRCQEKKHIRGIRTGFDRLDSILRGLRPKRMTVLAAATGFGKSSLALNLLANIAIAGHKALFLSNENDADDNLDRLCGIVSGVDLKDIEAGTQYKKVCSDFNRQFGSGVKMFLSDNSPRAIDEVVATINRYKLMHDIEIVFVDYIGEISGDAKDRENEEMKLARYAQRLVDCAKNMNIHIVVLAQLNRQGNTKGRPTKTELAGCFRIAQKAHSLAIFWQDESDGRKVDILTVDKNRQGPPQIDIAVNFERTNQRIREIGWWINASKSIRTE